MALFRGLTFDGVNSLSYGIYLTGEAVYNAPERAVEMVAIPGKNGALALDQGRFENIEVTYKAGCFADNQTDFADKVAEFRNALASRYNYKRITDDYNANEFRLGLYKSGLEVDAVAFHRAAEFAITFDCKPQRFLTSGEATQTITSGSNITNPTLFASRPLIIANGSGTVSIGSQIISISGITGDIYIDCDSMEIYTVAGGIISGASSHVTFNSNDFPTIPSGTTRITFTTNSLRIEPRWWRI